MAIITKITDGQKKVKTATTTPFLATVLGTANPKINYSEIREAKICGMMFYAGEYFDASHKEKTVYMNPSLPNQIEQCSSAGMPYALYVNVRAKNEIEADKECKTLYYIISRFSPQFGLWLSLQTTAKNNELDKILTRYYKYLNSWGLKDRCGLYIPTSKVSTFSWNKFKEKFYLWCIDPLEVSKIDTELLQPSMFEVPD